MSEEELIEYLHKYFTYHKDGTFTRSDRANSNGSIDKQGYVIIKIKRKQYKAHRLVFAYFNGRLPAKEIDHINRVRCDNRIENLREVSRMENNHNRLGKLNKDTGEVGIYFDKTRGLKARYAFSFGGKRYRFRSIQEAKEWREKLWNGLKN